MVQTHPVLRLTVEQITTLGRHRESDAFTHLGAKFLVGPGGDELVAG